MQVNGKTVRLEQDQTLLAFLTSEQFNCQTIAVERNGAIVPKEDYENVQLTDADTLEIVRFVGGG
ncbi:sulfur carrier protein ThiS [Sporomusa acidovorans]|uniref:Sulfur carrier protein ThiS n=1 Tax=Sporomusa acidovorans (strain ATCC 49682 / DSM 3132 / Mol) TaxID=1123286 RepID=A0ABZ3J8V0_SPOA4|nr:sulfur carrier protein ThiS [Sporomusa acidovorans]OZC24121.1 sulfur carrier protein ThiS [Sporomusa acidovorans DSM 3132]SDF71824.1 sulfur carrier protein [Sporomusa acidovorans]